MRFRMLDKGLLFATKSWKDQAGACAAGSLVDDPLFGDLLRRAATFSAAETTVDASPSSPPVLFARLLPAPEERGEDEAVVVTCAFTSVAALSTLVASDVSTADTVLVTSLPPNIVKKMWPTMRTTSAIATLKSLSRTCSIVPPNEEPDILVAMIGFFLWCKR